MKQAGQIVLVRFPFTDLSGSKLRPVLVLRRASARFDDWLVCMISSQMQQAEQDLDEVLRPEDSDFAATGLKAASVLRISRLAVVENKAIAGILGNIAQARVDAIRHRLAKWLVEEKP